MPSRALAHVHQSTSRRPRVSPVNAWSATGSGGTSSGDRPSACHAR
jgi:hypothetical protein